MTPVYTGSVWQLWGEQLVEGKDQGQETKELMTTTVSCEAPGQAKQKQILGSKGSREGLKLGFWSPVGQSWLLYHPTVWL